MTWRLLSAVAPPGTLSVLIFHRVFAERDPLMPGEPLAADFDRILGWLRSQYRVLPLDEAVVRLREGNLPPAAAAITFDDGYRDNHDVAAPLLERHGLPATFFVTTGYIDGGIMWNDAVAAALSATRKDTLDLEVIGLGRHRLDTWGERGAAHAAITQAIKHLPAADRDQAVRSIVSACEAPLRDDLMMTRAQVQALAKRGFQIGAHTVTHPILTRIADDEAQHEIAAGGRELENWLDRRVALFAYPNGRDGDDFDDRHRRMAREAGYDVAFSTNAAACRRDDDRFALPRFSPWRRDSESRFRLELWRNQWRRLPPLRSAA